MMIGPMAADVGLNQAKQVTGTGLWVCRDGQGLFAIDSRCTHRGCPVALIESSNSWQCPCHASRFAFDGSLLGGPATIGLSRYGVCKMADGRTLIDMTKSL